jgi:GxxExxY protein
MSSRLNQIGDVVVASAIRVHQALGPDLLESVYEACLLHEITRHGLSVQRQIQLPIRYDGIEIPAGLRIDLLIEQSVVLEIKAVEAVLPIHRAQILSYLRLGDFRLGYLLNFNVVRMRDGIGRLVNRFPDGSPSDPPRASASAASSAVERSK